MKATTQQEGAWEETDTGRRRANKTIKQDRERGIGHENKSKGETNVKEEEKKERQREKMCFIIWGGKFIPTCHRHSYRIMSSQTRTDTLVDPRDILATF